MPKSLTPSLFDGNSFEENVTRLEEYLGHRCEETSARLVILRAGGGVPNRTHIVKYGIGKFRSIAFLAALDDVFRTPNGGATKVAEAFFRHIDDDPKHETVQFLRKNEAFSIQVISDERFEERVMAFAAGESEDDDEVQEQVVKDVLMLLDSGVYRIAQQDGTGAWQTNAWLKTAILLSFKMFGNQVMPGPGDTAWFDKVPSKFAGWHRADFEARSFRAVPGAIVRHGAFIDQKVILMPSFVNIGGYVGEGTMVDTWATVGSCAQIGKNVHLSGGVGIGGVLEPAQATPTIIEDGAFIGARSEVVEGVIVRKRAVLSMGVHIGKNTPIRDRINDKTLFGEVPENAVVLPGIHPSNGLVCPTIVKYRDEKTDAATALNNALR